LATDNNILARQIPLYDPSFECHKDIARLVVARIKPEIRVRFVCSNRATGRNNESLAFIDIIPLSSAVPGLNKSQLTHAIGIPRRALVPERVAPIAYWLVKEFKRQRPDLFQPGNVTVIWVS
jgi:hypothetical protein